MVWGGLGRGVACLLPHFPQALHTMEQVAAPQQLAAKERTCKKVNQIKCYTVRGPRIRTVPMLGTASSGRERRAPMAATDSPWPPQQQKVQVHRVVASPRRRVVACIGSEGVVPMFGAGEWEVVDGVGPWLAVQGRWSRMLDDDCGQQWSCRALCASCQGTAPVLRCDRGATAPQLLATCAT